MAVHDLDRQQRESLKLSKLSKDQQKKKDNRAKKHLEVVGNQEEIPAAVEVKGGNADKNSKFEKPIQWPIFTEDRFAFLPHRECRRSIFGGVLISRFLVGRHFALDPLQRMRCSKR